MSLRSPDIIPERSGVDVSPKRRGAPLERSGRGSGAEGRGAEGGETHPHPRASSALLLVPLQATGRCAVAPLSAKQALIGICNFEVGNSRCMTVMANYSKMCSNIVTMHIKPTHPQPVIASGVAKHTAKQSPAYQAHPLSEAVASRSRFDILKFSPLLAALLMNVRNCFNCRNCFDMHFRKISHYFWAFLKKSINSIVRVGSQITRIPGLEWGHVGIIPHCFTLGRASFQRASPILSRRLSGAPAALATGASALPGGARTMRGLLRSLRSLATTQ